MNRLVLFVYSLLLFASCSQENTTLPLAKDATKEVTIRIIPKINDMVTGKPVSIGSPQSVPTRSVGALSSLQENTINNLWVLQYSGGSLVKSESFSSSGTNFNSFTLTLQSNTSCNIYFVANIGVNFSGLKTNPPSLETNFLNLSKPFNDNSSLYTDADGKIGIPMYGELKQQNVSANSTVAVSLTRLLARVDFTYSVSSSLSNFEFFRMQVCNVPLYMQLSPKTTPYPAASSTNFYYLTESVISSSTPTTKTFYLPANMQGTNAAITNPLNKNGDSFPYATFIALNGGTYGKYKNYCYYIGSSPSDYNVVPNSYYRITANITNADNSASDKRIITGPHSESKWTNCYMMKPGSTICIPIKPYFELSNKLFSTNYLLSNSLFTADVLWYQQKISSITAVVKGDYIEVANLPSNKGLGSGVVYAKVAGKIIWSWHIWVTNYEPGNTAPTSTSVIGGALKLHAGKYWLDRNLGNGSVNGDDNSDMFYQWGRKDPFPGTNYQVTYGNGISISTNKTNVDIATTFSNPNIFYGSGGGNYDWITALNNNLWSNTKTEYDPCPMGWKVPPYDGNYFPAMNQNNPGYYKVSGAFVAEALYVWSTTPVSTTYIAAPLATGKTNKSGDGCRGYGFPVRCVQE